MQTIKVELEVGKNTDPYGQVNDIRYKVTFGERILAVFTQEEYANKFIGSELCFELIKHFSQGGE